MASYRKRIERIQKRKGKNNKLLFSLKFFWQFTKSRFLSAPDFSKEITNLTKELLDKGTVEVRYYYGNDNLRYESLKDLHKAFADEHNLDLYYSEGIFEGVKTMLSRDLEAYTNTDLIIEEGFDLELQDKYLKIYVK